MERFETKYDLMNRVYQDSRLKRTTKAVMQYLVALSGKEKCNPAVSTIAQAIGMSERTVQRHMRLLEQYGYIERKSRYYRHEQITNEYVFILSVVDGDKKKRLPIGNREEGQKLTAAGASAEGIPSHPVRKKEYLEWIYQQNHSLGAAERVLFAFLTHKADMHGRVYGRIMNICQELHISRRQLKRLLCSIRSKGMIQLKSNQDMIAVQLRPLEEPVGTKEVKETTPAKKQDAVIRNHSAYENHMHKNIMPFIRKIIRGILIVLYHFLS